MFTVKDFSSYICIVLDDNYIVTDSTIEMTEFSLQILIEVTQYAKSQKVSEGYHKLSLLCIGSE